MCYLAALAAKIILGSFSACDPRSGVSLRHCMTFAVCRSAWGGVVLGFLQALAPVFLGATGPSLFSAQRGSGFYYFGSFTAKIIKTLGEVRARAWPWMLRA